MNTYLVHVHDILLYPHTLKTISSSLIFFFNCLSSCTIKTEWKHQDFPQLPFIMSAFQTTDSFDDVANAILPRISSDQQNRNLQINSLFIFSFVHMRHIIINDNNLRLTTVDHQTMFFNFSCNSF